MTWLLGIRLRASESDPKGLWASPWTILLEDVEQVRAVLARERGTLKTAVEPLVEIKMKPLEKIKKNLPGALYNKEQQVQHAERTVEFERLGKVVVGGEQ